MWVSHELKTLGYARFPLFVFFLFLSESSSCKFLKAFQPAITKEEFNLTLVNAQSTFVKYLESTKLKYVFINDRTCFDSSNLGEWRIEQTADILKTGANFFESQISKKN